MWPSALVLGEPWPPRRALKKAHHIQRPAKTAHVRTKPVGELATPCCHRLVAGEGELLIRADRVAAVGAAAAVGGGPGAKAEAMARVDSIGGVPAAVAVVARRGQVGGGEAQMLFKLPHDGERLGRKLGVVQDEQPPRADGGPPVPKEEVIE